MLSCLRPELALQICAPYHCIERGKPVASVAYIALLCHRKRNAVGTRMLGESVACLPARECAISRLETRYNTQQDPFPPNRMTCTSCKENPDSSTDKSHREGRILRHQTCRGHIQQKQNP